MTRGTSEPPAGAARGSFLGAQHAEAVQVADLNSVPVNGDGLDLTPMLAVDGVVFFRGRDAAHGWELWRSEGTAEPPTLQTREVAKFLGPPEDVVRMGSRIFFAAVTEQEGIWRSDGTATDTQLLRDTDPGIAGVLRPGCAAGSPGGEGWRMLVCRYEEDHCHDPRRSC